MGREALKAEHMEVLMEQPRNAHLKELLSRPALEAMEQSPWTESFVSGDRILACWGISEYWPGRAEAWAIFDGDCRQDFLSIHNAVKGYLAELPHRRVEAAVAVGFDSGHRWVKALGFQMEAPCLKGYLPSGGDCTLYARVKHG